MHKHTSLKRKRRRVFEGAPLLALQACIAGHAVDRPRISLRERIHEKRDANQRAPIGRVPHRDL